jgi:hypothetical protein
MTQNTPTAPLSLDAWQQELKQLATRAEELNPDASLQDRLAVASEWFRLLWLSCNPAWIARSCRLASRLCEPVMAMPAGVDVQVVSSWEARRFALKSVGALKELGPGPVADPSLIGKPIGRPPRAKPEPAPAPAPEPARVKVQAEAVTPRQLRPRSERIASRPAPAPEQPAEPDEAPVPAGWEVEPAAAPVAAPEPETLSTVELGSWWGMSVPWVHSLHRRGVVRAGVHYRKHQPGEPKGNRYFPGPTHQAISDATGRPIPPAPLQTVDECLQPRMKRKVLAEQVLAELQGGGHLPQDARRPPSQQGAPVCLQPLRDSGCGDVSAGSAIVPPRGMMPVSMDAPCSWAPRQNIILATTPPPLEQTGTVGGRAGMHRMNLDNRTD